MATTTFVDGTTKIVDDWLNDVDALVYDVFSGATSDATARTNLGVAIGSDVQAFGAVLDDLNTLGAAATDGEIIVATGAGVFAYESGATARTSLGAQADVITTRGDIIRGSSGASAERLALGSSGQILQSDGTDLVWGTTSLPKGYVSGLLISNDTDTAHDIAVATGECRDAADSTNIALTSVITKQIDATWAAGDDVGGLSSSLTAPANDTWYYVHAIIVGGAADVGFDTSATAANLVTDHSATAYCPIGWVLTNGSANIIQFYAYEMGRAIWVDFDDPSTDLGFDLTGGTAGGAFTASVPAMECIVVGRLHADDGDASETAAIYTNGMTEQESALATSPLSDAGIIAGGSTSTGSSVGKLVRCNSSGQLYYGVSLGANVDWQTLGFIAKRG